MAYFDTHRAIEKIIATGVSKGTAEAIVDIVNNKDDKLVTKNDLTLAISELKFDIGIINTNVKWLMAIVLVVLGILLKNIFIV